MLSTIKIIFIHSRIVKWLMGIMMISLTVNCFSQDNKYSMMPSPINNGLDHYALTFSSDNVQGWICGSFGEILLTDNGGRSWKRPKFRISQADAQ